MKIAVFFLLFRSCFGCLATPDMDLPSFQPTTEISTEPISTSSVATSSSTSSSTSTATTTTSSTASTTTTTSSITTSTTTTCPKICPATPGGYPVMELMDLCYFKIGAATSDYTTGISLCDMQITGANYPFIQNAAQNTALQSAFGATSEFYLAFQRIAPTKYTNAAFQDTYTGATMVYDNWNTGYPAPMGEPDNLMNNENCVTMQTTPYTGRWADVACTSQYFPVCQTDLICA